LIDRIDIHLEVAALPPEQLVAMNSVPSENSATVARRVDAARRIQMDRQGKPNGRLLANETMRLCRLDQACRTLVGAAITRLGLSARAYQRILKLARTCADLAGEPEIAVAHVAEAVRLRAFDRFACGGETLSSTA
jgi:magnesium chelatase family protein